MVRSLLAGDLASYEETLRALYKRDKKKFLDCLENWPQDIRKYILLLAKEVFDK